MIYSRNTEGEYAEYQAGTPKRIYQNINDAKYYIIRQNVQDHIADIYFTHFIYAAVNAADLKLNPRTQQYQKNKAADKQILYFPAFFQFHFLCLSFSVISVLTPVVAL
jgi:hypothetical protein